MAGGLPSSHLLDGVVADEDDCVSPGAAPHPHVGAGAEGTAQAAGCCPHHLPGTENSHCQPPPTQMSHSGPPRPPAQGSVSLGNHIPSTRISQPGCCVHHRPCFVTRG